MIQRAFITSLFILAVATVSVRWREHSSPAPRIPAFFETSLPPDCRQVMLVLSPAAGSVTANLWLLEMGQTNEWHKRAGPFAVTLGYKGLAWGDGEHTSPPPAGFRVKHEGDGCSPAGVFRIPFAFGLAPEDQAGWLRLPYTPLTPTIIGVDDPKSRYYNQVVDNTKVKRDWDSNEAMMRHDGLYRWGAFIAHNPRGTPGLGSCIFLHLWPGPGRSTAGCTGMSEEDITQVLRWLDPEKEPRIVQGLEAWVDPFQASRDGTSGSTPLTP